MRLVFEKRLLDHHQLIGRQATQEFFHPRIRLSRQDGFVGVLGFRRIDDQPILGVDRPGAAAQQVDPLVAGDGVDPGGGRRPLRSKLAAFRHTMIRAS